MYGVRSWHDREGAVLPYMRVSPSNTEISFTTADRGMAGAGNPAAPAPVAGKTKATCGSEAAEGDNGSAAKPADRDATADHGHADTIDGDPDAAHRNADAGEPVGTTGTAAATADSQYGADETDCIAGKYSEVGTAAEKHG